MTKKRIALCNVRVLNILRHLRASFVWFRVSLVAILFPLYLSIGIFSRRFRVILLFLLFFGKTGLFFTFFIKFAKNLGKMCQNDETSSIVK